MMNPSSNLLSEDAPASETIPPPLFQSTRPFYWSVRRELWENRSIYLAPLVVAAVVLFSFLISTIRLPQRMRALAALAPATQDAKIIAPFNMAPAPIMLATFIVAFFYCLDAMQGERRDRSILFWKSLPVSDRTTVLSKAAIPFVVLPLIALGLAWSAQLIMLIVSTVVLAGSGLNPGMLWTRLPFFQLPLVMFYGLAAHVLWFAPIYGWLLLVSAWANRATILWAALPFVAIMIIERIAFGSSRFAALMGYRVTGAMKEAFSSNAFKTHVSGLSQLAPLQFLATPGLWLGLAFAAVFLTATVRLRRYREPI